ncbi:hypothetical protein J4450_06260 [Candidatus Micrarchaeota archaeon]|nr:hypothetical protein [Candidatus Micrarchaeota archaeon]
MKKIIIPAFIILLFLFTLGCSKPIETKEIKNETNVTKIIETNKTEKVEIKNTTEESNIANNIVINATNKTDFVINTTANVSKKKEEPKVAPLNSSIPNMEKMMKEGKSPEDFMKNLPPDFDPSAMDPAKMDDKMKQYMSDFFNTPKFDLSKNAPPKFVKNNFIELDRIAKISKFRSGYGHDYSLGTGEKCRSMKHYFWPKGGEPGKPHDSSWTSIKYYSPVDGVIKNVEYTETTYGKEAKFSIQSSEQPAFRFIFFHVNLLSSFKEGSKVSAGQHIGTIADENSHGEIAVEVVTTSGRGLVSFFDVMDDSLFENYKKKGIKIRSDSIISKEQRDAKPLVCDYSTPDGRFTGASGVSDFRTWQTDSDNWFELN